jgi:16S rRNA (guanine527-N7)-methyltransferase
VADRFKHDIENLLDLLVDAGIGMRPETAGLLGTLCELIERWNEAVNLVSRKDIGRLVSYHFCDSASLLPLVQVDRPTRMLDVGGSNGLPGLVLSAISPHIEVMVCDSKLKRRGFLDEACTTLKIGAEFELDRIDSGGFRQRYQESFDLIVARAVTRLKQLLRWCLPLVRPGGLVVAYKGSRCLEEVGAAQAELTKHGGKLLAAIGSPWAGTCNPLRVFAIAAKGSRQEVGTWER